MQKQTTTTHTNYVIPSRCNEKIVTDIMDIALSMMDENRENFLASLREAQIENCNNKDTYYVSLTFRPVDDITVHIFTSTIVNAIEEVEGEPYRDASMSGVHLRKDRLSLSFFVHRI